MRSWCCYPAIVAGMAFLGGTDPGQAQEQSVVWNRAEGSSAGSGWLSPVHWVEQAGMEIWTTEIRPTGSGQGMLVTVVFRPSPGGFVRAIWRGPSESVTLSADLVEGNPPWHQRSLFLDASRISSGGQIWLEAKGSALERVRLEWVDGMGWGLPQKGRFVQSGSGRLLRAEELYGDAYRTEPAESVSWVVETLLQPGPLPIHERSVRLHVPLAEAVDYARLEFWVAGLSADEAVLFSLNEAPWEELDPEVPRLEDPGYLHQPEKNRTDLAGWRQVVRFLPGSALRKGPNTFWFGSGGSPGNGEIVIRNLRLQTVFTSSAPFSHPQEGESSAAHPKTPGQENAGLSFRSEGVGLRP